MPVCKPVACSLTIPQIILNLIEDSSRSKPIRLRDSEPMPGIVCPLIYNCENLQIACKRFAPAETLNFNVNEALLNSNLFQTETVATEPVREAWLMSIKLDGISLSSCIVRPHRASHPKRNFINFEVLELQQAVSIKLGLLNWRRYRKLCTSIDQHFRLQICLCRC